MRLIFNRQNIILAVLICAALPAAAIHAAVASSTAPLSTIGASQLKKEIASEKARVLQLTKSLQPVPGITRTLRRSSSGKDVQLLQEFLKLYGAFSTTTASSGYFGAQTAQAVKEFQYKEHIDPVGAVGPKTRARILALSTHELVEVTTPAASSSATVPDILDAIVSSDVAEDGSGVGSSALFASTTKNIYAILTLAHAAQSSEIGLIRYYNGTYVDSAVTHPSRSGLRYLHVQWALKPGGNRAPGLYTVVFYMNGKKSKTVAFTIN